MDFRELTDDEVRQHPSYPVVQLRPPPIAAALPAPAPSASAAKQPAAKAVKAGPSNPEQVSIFTAAQTTAEVSLPTLCSVLHPMVLR